MQSCSQLKTVHNQIPATRYTSTIYITLLLTATTCLGFSCKYVSLPYPHPAQYQWLPFLTILYCQLSISWNLPVIIAPISNAIPVISPVGNANSNTNSNILSNPQLKKKYIYYYNILYITYIYIYTKRTIYRIYNIYEL